MMYEQRKELYKKIERFSKSRDALHESVCDVLDHA